jgi:hypothetical protein
MKNLLLALLLSLPFTISAQAPQAGDPIAVLGDIQPVMIEGRKTLPTLTIPLVLENPPKIKNVSGFTISHFCVSVDNKERMEVYGPLCSKTGEYTADIKEMLTKNAFGGGKVYLDEIRVIGPDKRTRTVNSITINYR